MEHILANEIVTQIRENNAGIVDGHIDSILDATKKIRNSINNTPKGDQSLVILVYCRVGNDFVTSANNIGFGHTTISATDMQILKGNFDKAVDCLISGDE